MMIRKKSVECRTEKSAAITIAGTRTSDCGRVAVRAKHSKSFSLIDCISVSVDRMQRNFEPMRKQVDPRTSTSWSSKGTRSRPT